MNMIVKLGIGAVAILLCLAGGAAYAVHSMRIEAHSGNFIDNGQWYTDPAIGGTDASLRTRAYVAVVGLLALSRQETVYFLLHEDERGEPLSSDSIYEIVGDDLPARWWSITAYAEDHFLNPNPYNRYSIRDRDTAREPDGSYRIVVSREPVDGNWIPLGEGDHQSLLLRLYNPDPDIQLDTVDLPVVRKIGDAQ